MLNACDVMATVAVKDLRRARDFYEGKLGLAPAAPPEEQMVALKSGATTLLLYVSEFAGTHYPIFDRGLYVARLKAQGVPFEHYDMPGITRQGDVHVGGGRKVAWARDPDGNLLCLAHG